MEPKFVRVGSQVINLANVTDLFQSNALGASSQLEGIVIRFVGDTSLVVYKDKEGYRDVSEWMARQPSFVFAK